MLLNQELCRFEIGNFLYLFGFKSKSAKLHGKIEAELMAGLKLNMKTRNNVAEASNL